jgi:hypothetical protein
MPISLSKEHRKLLENTTGQARVLAESASKAALENLAVHEKEYRTHMSVDQRTLRNRLRSRGRALGDKRDERTGLQGIHHLKELAAYEHWHRLLFTRFLTENHLLITDEANGSVPITLEECEELAPELGARDGFDLACRFASLILPGVFRRDDPVLDLPIALNDQVELRNLLSTLPVECFQADDALGWTYQFWQAQRKNEVNASGKKIGADELSPVTQLFTEDYMVEFLLHNTLGAWWAGKLGPIQAASEEEARAFASLSARNGVPAIVWSYLRFVQDETTKTWLPAAGKFDGWPKTANLIRLLDPCMGSGHFLVFALPLLVRLRMEEEQLAPKAAVNAVLNDNIHGLELDERCTQIAAFNVALTVWKLAGYQNLPQLHLACSGLAPSATEAEWLALAGVDDRLKNGMARLYRLFEDAPELGSLINPRIGESALLDATFQELKPLLEKAVAQETKDDAVHEMAVTAHGLAKVAEILTDEYTLAITNVPYLVGQNQSDILRDWANENAKDAKGDLAYMFVSRMLKWLAKYGTVSVVAPQNWLFQTSSRKFRERLLKDEKWNMVARLGPGAFETIGGHVVNVAMIIISCESPQKGGAFSGLDVTDAETPILKSRLLQGHAHALIHASETTPSGSLLLVVQDEQLVNPDARITLASPSTLQTLEPLAICRLGLGTGDAPHYIRKYWEFSKINGHWAFFQNTSDSHTAVGYDGVVAWDSRLKRVYGMSDGERRQAHNQDYRGREVWGERGISISIMGSLRACDYSGQLFDKLVATIIPKDYSQLPALSAYLSSATFAQEVRKLDKKVSVTNATLIKVPFDLAHWQKVAAEKYPNGLPKPFSSDPTQWLFNGHPKGSDQPLHVAVARLLGYAWPRQTGSSFPDCPALGPDGLEGFADSDGIVCLPPVNHEQPAANRLRELVAAALGTFDEGSLIAAAGLKGSKSKTLGDWLRDEFFEQHAKLFHDRPFIWHLWDGRSDGFHALVNYHKLDYATLQKLAYSYLGNWIQVQADDAKVDKPGAADRLGAAQKLQKKLAAILEGEAPLDIFVRWKPLKDQPEGWHPDLNDGIRQNIRPFLPADDVGKKGAGLFRAVPLKLKDSDRGNEPNRPKEDYPWFWCEDEPGTDPAGGKDFVGTRWNNVHLTLEKKKGSKA